MDEGTASEVEELGGTHAQLSVLADGCCETLCNLIPAPYSYPLHSPNQTCGASGISSKYKRRLWLPGRCQSL